MSKFRAKRLDNGQWAIGDLSGSYLTGCVTIEDMKEMLYKILGNIYDTPEELRQYLYLSYPEKQLMLKFIEFSNDLIIDGDFHDSRTTYSYELARIYDRHLQKIQYISIEFNQINPTIINIQLTDNELEYHSNIPNLPMIGDHQRRG